MHINTPIFCYFLIFITLIVIVSTKVVEVVRVVDGDTVITRDSYGKTQRVRLAEINTPETNENGFHEAKDYLRERVEGNYVNIKQYGYDHYGRSVADIYDRSGSVNDGIVREGYGKPAYSSQKKIDITVTPMMTTTITSYAVLNWDFICASSVSPVRVSDKLSLVLISGWKCSLS